MVLRTGWYLMPLVTYTHTYRHTQKSQETSGVQRKRHWCLYHTLKLSFIVKLRLYRMTESEVKSAFQGAEQSETFFLNPQSTLSTVKWDWSLGLNTPAFHKPMLMTAAVGSYSSSNQEYFKAARLLFLVPSVSFLQSSVRPNQGW